MNAKLRRHDVVLARLPLGYATYLRPCVVVFEPEPDRIPVLAISTKQLHTFKHSAFRIDSNDPDFAATGLAESSFVLADPLYTADDSMIGTRIGRLEGDLAKRFEKWFGS